MPFHLSSDQELIQKTVRELVAPVKGKPAEHVDRERAWPKAHLASLAQMGLMAMLVPADKGGAGTDTVSFVAALDEIARVSGTTAVALNNLNAMGTYPVARYATDAAREAALAGALTAEKPLAWALTEPGAGSDTAALQTRAVPDGDGFVLHGLKSFVVGAPHAGAFVTFARVEGEEAYGAFLVPADAEGVRVAPPERTMSLRGLDMAQVFLKGVRLDADARLGGPGEGPAIVQACQDVAALGAAAISVGLMQAALDDAAQYANDREQFRMPIKNFQAIQFLVADMDVKVRAARLLTLEAADRRDRDEPFATHAAAAKLFAAESARFVTQKSLRIHGGTGFMRDLPVERYNRDARALSIYAGTSEAMRARLGADALDV